MLEFDSNLTADFIPPVYCKFHEFSMESFPQKILIILRVAIPLGRAQRFYNIK